MGPIPPRVQKALAQLDEAGLRDEKATLADLIRQSQAGKEAGEGTAGRGAAEDDTFKSDSSDEAMFWGFQPCSRSRWHRTHPTADGCQDTIREQQAQEEAAADVVRYFRSVQP